MHKVQLASNQDTINQIIVLRYEVLRKPWNKSIESATDELELECINAYIQNDEEIIACARMQYNSETVAQIRFMAVNPMRQGKGLGKLLMNELEVIAKQKNIHMIELQARENAVAFYKSCGYLIKEPSFKLWDIIQHYLMIKTIK